MSEVILKVENINKQYRLGTVGTGTLSHDLNRFWHKIRGKEDPYLKVGTVNDRSKKASSDYVWALRDINFEVKRGEILGIIGKNGAGKSTLLKILSRVTAPTTGSIKTKGRIASLLEVGTGMHPELTGRENIYLNGAILGMTKAEIASKLEEIVDFSGCEMYIDTPVKRYSSGMRVRLGFAVAAFLEPDILVVDEVLAVGDAEFQKKAIGKMKDISNTTGRTVLFVSHNMGAIRDLCTRAIVIENGILRFDGSTNDSVSHYLSSNSHSEEDLASRTDRLGNQAIKLKKVRIVDTNERSIEAIGPFDPFSIVFEYERDTSIEIKKLLISIQIIDANQNIIAAFPSDEYCYDFNTNSNSFRLNIEMMNFRSSSYTINFLSFDTTTETLNYIDRIDNVFTFTVLNTKMHTEGRLARPGSGVLLKAKFSD
ncbi:MULTISPECIES: ABC transporter ATP-binding protein [Nonlabens]|nr:ABC transporter ATP-binding protein [Nonlabens tegetincola]